MTFYELIGRWVKSNKVQDNVVALLQKSPPPFVMVPRRRLGFKAIRTQSRGDVFIRGDRELPTVLIINGSGNAVLGKRVPLGVDLQEGYAGHVAPYPFINQRGSKVQHLLPPSIVKLVVPYVFRILRAAKPFR